jgi:hypothetical protein
VKIDYKQIEIDECKINDEFSSMNGFIEIREATKFDNFIYQNPNPNLFKIVLHWRVTLQTPDGKKWVAKIEGEQEIITLWNDEDDLADIKNAISTSHYHLQDYFSIQMKETPLNDYLFLAFDTQAAAKSISDRIQPLRDGKQPDTPSN